MTAQIMEKAQKALTSAKILLAAGDTDGATNRAYYAMFDAAIAALSWAGLDAAEKRHKTHNGMIASFGLHLVQTGYLPADFGRNLNRVQELRMTADYLDAPVSNDKPAWSIEQADSFVDGVRQLLAQPKPPSP